MLYTLNYRTLPGTKNCREKYGEINAELNRKFAKGEYFDSSEVYVEDGYLCVGEGFFRLSGKEQDALIEYLCPEEDSTEE